MKSPTFSPIRVVFLDHTARWSGGEVSLFDLVTHLDRTRVAPLVVLFEDGPLRECLEAAQIPVEVLPLGETVSQTRKDALGARSLLQGGALVAAWRHARRLRRLIKARGVQIVHCNSLKSDLLGALAGRWARVPVVWHVRDRIAPDYLPAPVVRAFRAGARRLPTRVIAISEAVAATLPGADVRVVHNGVSLRDFAALEPRDFNAQSPVFGLVGRLAPWKGQHVFLEAAAIVRRELPRARFRIIGSALFGEEDYEAELRQLTKHLNLEDAVEFCGFQEDVPRVMAELDALVHASITGEPFGRVLIEAMAAARPVVATNGGGVPEVVAHGETGLLVPMNDAPALAAAMLELAKNPESAQQMGRAGRERARERFDIEQVARRVEALWQELI